MRNEGWDCQLCTYRNDSGGSCEICSTSRNLDRNILDGAAEPSELWECRACTFINNVDGSCAVCETSRVAVKPFLDKLPGLQASGAKNGKDLAHEEDGTLANSGQQNVHTAKSKRPTDFQDTEIRQNSLFPPWKSGEDTQSKDNTFRRDGSGSGSISFGQWLKAAESTKRKRTASEDPENQFELVPLTRAKSVTSKSVEDGASIDLSPAPENEVTNDFLARLHAERCARKGSRTTAPEREPPIRAPPGQLKHESSIGDGDNIIVILTYNVWFNEEMELEKRVSAIGKIIQDTNPHVVCLQEVTANIYSLLRKMSWWSQYRCSITSLATAQAYFTMQLSRLPLKKFHQEHFQNSIMGRNLCCADVETDQGVDLVVATAHLESPCPAPPTWNQMFSPERVAQANEAFRRLQEPEMINVIFCGDMNWDDKLDGAPPLPQGWYDAWNYLRPGQPGLTYDCQANPMLTGGRIRKRVDRLFCRLQDFVLESVEMVGTEPIPGVFYQKELTVKKQVKVQTLPVLPSDHFGLLLKLRTRVSQPAQKLATPL